MSQRNSLQMSIFIVVLLLSPLLHAVPVDKPEVSSTVNNEDIDWGTESFTLNTVTAATATVKRPIPVQSNISAEMPRSASSRTSVLANDQISINHSSSALLAYTSQQWPSPSTSPPYLSSPRIFSVSFIASSLSASTNTPFYSPIIIPTISSAVPSYLATSHSPAQETSSSLHAIACQQMSKRSLGFMGQSHSKLSRAQPKKESWRNALKDNLKETMMSFGVGDGQTPSHIPIENIFVPIQEDTNILSQIDINCAHPMSRMGVLDDDSKTMHTNKFYANAFLGQQNQPIWTQPYYMWWGKGAKQNGQVQTWGMNIGHTELQDVLYSGDKTPVQAYLNLRQQSLVLSARELDTDIDEAVTLSTDTHLPFSVNINLNAPSPPSERKITFPVVQGMGFVSANYSNATPTIHTGGGGFQEVLGTSKAGNVAKYLIKDKDDRAWIIYVIPTPGLKYNPSAFVRANNNTLLGPAGFCGLIQVAKNPLGKEGEALYDEAAGTYVTGATITGTVNDTKGTYSLIYNKTGTSTPLMFALSHHIESLDPEMNSRVTKLQLRTTTKGIATAISTDTLTFIEPQLPVGMCFGPWNPAVGTCKIHYPTSFLNFLAGIAERDLNRSMNERIPQDSMYYAGKSLAKLATIVWVIHDVLNNTSLATKGLEELKLEMQRYVENKQQFRLNYDDTWKGIVSTAGYANAGADFGNTYYNDHHFHYGYFVYTSAVIGSLDPKWLDQGDNKEWTNMLVKDYAESDYNGRDYPFSRAFDWWAGHSWAKGLFESADGKDEESTSEDGFASYAIKMWGKTIGDSNMENRGNLMLAIQARSFNNYFYLTSTNKNHPANFIPNKVTGILFENKVDYTTYFGSLPQYIHGIHMLPVSPPSTYLRPKAFVQEEWDAKFGGDNATLVDGGWRGVLYANLALIDPKASFLFFRNGVDGFWDDAWIDGGASRTWYLVLAAGLGGAGR